MDKPETVIENMILVNLMVKHVTGVRKDKDAEDKVADEFKCGRDTYSIRISQLPKEYTLRYRREIAELRRYFYTHTVPWENRMWYAISTRKFQELEDHVNLEIKEIKKIFKSDVIMKYDEMKKNAKVSMGKLFKDEEFPTQEQLERGMQVKFDVGAVPSPEDIRLVGIDKIAKDKLYNTMKTKQEDKVKGIALKLISRIKDVTDDMLERVSSDEQEGKRYKILMESLPEMVEAVEDLNICNNEVIVDTCKRIRDRVSKYSPQSIRTAEFVRSNIAEELGQINEELETEARTIRSTGITRTNDGLSQDDFQEGAFSWSYNPDAEHHGNSYGSNDEDQW